MTPNDYQQAALRTAPGDLPPERLLLNVDKLKARYPDGFDAEHSLHRDQDDI